jgi:hypothetical protein
MSIKHVVMWKLKPEADDRSAMENAQIMKKALENLRLLISEIWAIRVFVDLKYDDNAYDVLLEAIFADKNDLKRYLESPYHKMVAVWIKEVRAERTVVDVEI